MPSDEELAKAIEEMRKQGLSDDEIRETLADMGAPDDVIARLLGGVASSAAQPLAPAPPVKEPRPQQSKSNPSDDDLFAQMSPSRSSDVVSNLLGSNHGSDTSVQSNDIAAQPAPEPVEPISVEPKPLSAPPVVTPSDETPSAAPGAPVSPALSQDDLAEIKEMLRELKRELRDQRAMLSALQKILQEILDTDRSLIVGLYEKAKK